MANKSATKASSKKGNRITVVTGLSAAALTLFVFLPMLEKRIGLMKDHERLRKIRSELILLSSLAREVDPGPEAAQAWNTVYQRGLGYLSHPDSQNIRSIRSLKTRYLGIETSKTGSLQGHSGDHSGVHNSIDNAIISSVDITDQIFQNICNTMFTLAGVALVIFGLLLTGVINNYFSIYLSLIRPLKYISAHIKDGSSDQIPKNNVYSEELSELVVCYNRQVSNYKLSNNILSEKKALLEEANAAQANFFINLSHEIRTPLNGISGFIELLKSEKLPEQTRDYFHNIDESCEMLLAIVNDTMDMSKLGSGKYVINNSVFSVKEIVRESHLLLINSLSEHKISYTLDYPETGISPIYSDRLRVKQVLINLMTNAIKYTREGGTVRTVVRQEAVGQNSCLNTIQVSDTGIGIRNENLEKIFEPFVQGEIFSESRYGGTGLGLSICKKIAEVLDGKLSVKSEYGKGSEFTFSFRSKTASLQSSKNTCDKATSAHFRTDLQILIVEDNLINQKVLKKMLLKAGLSRIDVVTNPLNSFDLVCEKSYDIVFMDLKMPEMDGITTAKKILAIPEAGTPVIIAITANSFEEEKNLCFQSGFSAYLTKPVKMHLITGELSRHFPPGGDRPTDSDGPHQATS